MKSAIKYTPDSLSDVIYPNTRVQTRIAGYATGQLEGHLLLWGSNGTSKTTIANLLPFAISGASACIEDKDFDDLLSKKDLKSYLKQSCSVAQLTGSSKYFLVMHEFDNAKVNLSKLWTAMDKCEDELMVIITTNNPMAVHQSIRSRCDQIEFPKLMARQVLERAQFVLRTENIFLPDYQVLHYLKQEESFGDLRRYFKKVDEIIFISNSGLQLPPVPSPNAANQPAFKLVNKFNVRT